MKGRKPKPTALKKVMGNPGKRPLDENEFSLPLLVGADPPESLDDVGQREWRRVVPILLRVKLVTELDLAIVLGYCQSFSEFVASSKQVKKGMVGKTKDGYPMINPYFSILNKSSDKMLKYAQELGLTPVQRARIKLMPDDSPKHKDEFDE